MAAAGTWKVNASTMVIVDTPVSHRYRVCSSATSKGNKLELKVDGAVAGEPLKPGACRDVMGKKIEIVQAGGNDSSGTYDNLD